MNFMKLNDSRLTQTTSPFMKEDVSIWKDSSLLFENGLSPKGQPKRQSILTEKKTELYASISTPKYGSFDSGSTQKILDHSRMSPPTYKDMELLETSSQNPFLKKSNTSLENLVESDVSGKLLIQRTIPDIFLNILFVFS